MVTELSAKLVFIFNSEHNLMAARSAEAKLNKKVMDIKAIAYKEVQSLGYIRRREKAEEEFRLAPLSTLRGLMPLVLV